MKINMGYFKSKIKALREEYIDADKIEIIKSKGGRCELCGRKEGDKYVFGPTHYIKKRVLFKVHIHIHKIKSHGDTHTVVICDGCHLSYHLFNRLDSDAKFGDKTIKHVSNSNKDKVVISRIIKYATKGRGK